MKKLNLGCGEFPKSGYINVDSFFDSAQVKHDLENFPYPFGDDEFSLIELSHVLEHLSQPFEVMRELSRIGRNGAVIVIKVPHFSRGFTHPDHKRGFDITFPWYFDNQKLQFFQGIRMKLIDMKFEWYAQPYLKKKVISPFLHYPLLGISKIINFFANFSPAFCSRIWCFWVGGFEELEFTFKIIK